MKRFEVKVRYTFDGHYVVRAASETDAARMAACPEWGFSISGCGLLQSSKLGTE